jgi:hypothetical protein
VYEAVFVAAWPWWIAGPAIGLVVILLAWLTGKPLGVSTGYGTICALGSRVSFFQAKEYAERWRLAFIVGLPLGGLLAAGSPDRSRPRSALDSWTRTRAARSP